MNLDDAPLWFRWALGEIGVREVPGRGSNSRILAYRKLAKIAIEGDDSDVPWCAIFVNAALEQCGIKGSRSPAARSFLTMATGQKLKKPSLGAITVLKRGNSSWQGHVGFYRGETKDFVYLLNGNANDKVGIDAFPKDKILGHIWPVAVPEYLLSGPVKIMAGRKVSDTSMI